MTHLNVPVITVITEQNKESKKDASHIYNVKIYTVY